MQVTIIRTNVERRILMPLHSSASTISRCTKGFTVTLIATTVLAAGIRVASASEAVNIRRSRVTGLAVFVTPATGDTIPVQPGAGAARLAPTDFFRQYGHLFGVTAPNIQLVLAGTDYDALGYAHTTYHQIHKGIPVFAGVLKVHQNSAGGVTAANGDFFPIPAKLNTAPTLDPTTARGVALASIRALSPKVERSELVLVDPGWYGDPPRGVRLAYLVVLADPSGPLEEAFFVDAHDGSILDRWSLIHAGRSRVIHDAYGGPRLPGVIARIEGDPPTGSADVDAAYDYFGDVYDYYSRAFGRDGIDGYGMDMVATVNSTAPDCPNAFWSSTLQQMVFCTGTATDDIVGHELTHGVTSYTSSLVYQNQSGQLNESFSDIFGELIDLFNGNQAFLLPHDDDPTWPTHPTGPGTDTPNTPTVCYDGSRIPNGVRWLVGEDADVFGGAIRNMWEPACLGDPDRAFSPLQICNVYDHGGVHSGAGVANHAFAIMTDGKDFNGQSVVGIGPIKAGAVWYRAQTVYLTPAADFEDAYAALNQAALDLVGTAPNDPRTGAPSQDLFIADDAAQVDRALLAVEMNTPGRCGQTTPVLNPDPPPECAAHTIISANDFENGAGAWTVSNSGPPTPYDWVLTDEPLPFGRSGTAWFCADRNIGDCAAWDESAVHSLFSPPIALPDDAKFPVLTFTHCVETERGWDGGNLKISVNGLPWMVVSPLTFYYNRYNALPLNSTLLGNTNPLAGEPGFTGVGGGWGKSVVHLSDVMIAGTRVGGGDTVRFRFDFGKDGCSGVTGWYVDDFAVYDCSATTDCNNNGILDAAEMSGEPYREVVLQQPPTYGGAALSDTADADGNPFVAAENFYLTHPKTIEALKIWGRYIPNNMPPRGDDFAVVFHRDENGLPGTVVPTHTQVFATVVPDPDAPAGIPTKEITINLAPPVTLTPGGYFVEIFNTSGTSSSFLWLAADYIAFGSPAFAVAEEAPGEYWAFSVDYGWFFNLAIEIHAGMIGEDCNDNFVPDDCEPDCNGNGTPDECDILGGTSEDCAGDGIPDECEPDCNGNGVADSCDITFGTSEDCSANGTPDECEPDCNYNGVADSCDILDGMAEDCNANEIPDDCELAAGTSFDCNDNNILDECDISAGISQDCNSNLVPDECEPDSDGDGIIDGCDACPETELGRPVDANGCAANQLDDDNDGVTNDLDACPGTGDGLAVDENGCSDGQRDDDGDGVANGEDGCRDDPNKVSPGECGCGNPDTDSDGDGRADCIDECPNDPDKIFPGACGCGVLDTDSDHDGAPDCVDQCPSDPYKIAAGECGCGFREGDSDQDGVPDCKDGCPVNPAKTEPGVCGCLTPETDSDRDGTPDCKDQCPDDPAKQELGECGCGTADIDTDGDGTSDCRDDCPEDPNKIEPGACGCGESDDDLDRNGTPDCMEDRSSAISSDLAEPTSLTVSGPVRVVAGSSAAYAADMEYSDNSVADVTHEVSWAVYSAESDTAHVVYTGAATISNAGVLTPRENLPANIELMIVAAYRAGTVELKGVQLVTVAAVEPEAPDPARSGDADGAQDPRLCGLGIIGALVLGFSTLFVARVSRWRRFGW